MTSLERAEQQHAEPPRVEQEVEREPRIRRPCICTSPPASGGGACYASIGARSSPARTELRLVSERVAGIEPAIQSWGPCLLPLQHTRGARLSEFIAESSLAPTELHGRTAAVAIRAADIAFPDLRQHTRPAPRHHHSRHVHELQLGVAMIEFEHDRVRSRAVDARMRLQVAQDLAPVLLTPSPYLSDRAPHIVRFVCEVMRAPVGSVTGPAKQLRAKRGCAARRNAEASGP